MDSDVHAKLNLKLNWTEGCPDEEPVFFTIILSWEEMKMQIRHGRKTRIEKVAVAFCMVMGFRFILSFQMK